MPDTSPADFPLTALVVHWGGVLTADLDASMAQAMAGSGVDLEQFGAVLGEWLGPEAQLETRVNPLHALERGEMAVPHFEERLADELMYEAKSGGKDQLCVRVAGDLPADEPLAEAGAEGQPVAEG